MLGRALSRIQCGAPLRGGAVGPRRRRLCWCSPWLRRPRRGRRHVRRLRIDERSGRLRRAWWGRGCLGLCCGRAVGLRFGWGSGRGGSARRAPWSLGRRVGALVFGESRQRVEDVRATSAADIALRYAQVRCRYHQSQGAFWTDREHVSFAVVVREGPPNLRAVRKELYQTMRPERVSRRRPRTP